MTVIIAAAAALQSQLQRRTYGLDLGCARARHRLQHHHHHQQQQQQLLQLEEEEEGERSHRRHRHHQQQNLNEEEDEERHFYAGFLVDAEAAALAMQTQP